MLPSTMRWVIRSEPQRALERLAVDRFGEDASARLRRHWPATCAALGDAGLEARIRQVSATLRAGRSEVRVNFMSGSPRH